MTEHDQNAERPVDTAKDSPVPADTDEMASDASEVAEAVVDEEGPVRRALIRATLKPGEGVPPTPREAPVFTMHQQTRSGNSERSTARTNRPFRENGNLKKPGNGFSRGRSNNRTGSLSRRGKGRPR